MELNIEKCLIISLSHLTQNEFMKLVDLDFVSNDCYPTISFDILDILEVDEEQIIISNSLMKIIELAKENDCSRIRFDRDANTIEGYEVFEW